MTNSSGTTMVMSRDARTGTYRTTGIAESAADDVNRAVEAADAASSSLAALTPTQLSGVLRVIAAFIADASPTLARSADTETALGEEQLRAELARCVTQFHHFADVVSDGAYLDVTIDHRQGTTPDLRRWMTPTGVVAVFAASNFPFAFSVLGGDVASAFAAACPVVVKAHPGHPLTSEASVAVVRDALHHAGLPANTIGIVYGVPAGEHLVTHPRVAAVGFTGSTPGGQALARLAASRPRPIPFYGELGSINPVVVYPDAITTTPQRDTFAAGLVQSFTYGHGQLCTKPGVVLIPTGPDGDDTVHRIVDAARHVPPHVLLTDAIRSNFARRLDELADNPHVTVHTAITTTATVETANPSPARTQPLDHTVPTVVASTTAAAFLADDALRDEVFGPFTLLVRYPDSTGATHCLDAVHGSLAAALHTAAPHDKDPESPTNELHTAALRCAGRLVYNGFTTGVTVTWSMQHGGPFPASTNAHSTSVGAAAVRRWLRPVVLQNAPADRHHPAVANGNPWNLPRRVDGRYEPGTAI